MKVLREVALEGDMGVLRALRAQTEQAKGRWGEARAWVNRACWDPSPVRWVGLALGVALLASGVLWWWAPRESLLPFMLSPVGPGAAVVASAAGAALIALRFAQARTRWLALALVALAPWTVWALANATQVWWLALSSASVRLRSVGWAPASLGLALVTMAAAWATWRATAPSDAASANTEPPAGWGMRGVRLALGGLLTLLIPLHMVMAVGGTDYRRPSDTAVVLGAHAFADGPSHALQDRLDTGIALYEAGLVRRLVMTGGFSGPVSEPKIMRAYAVEAGIPYDAIVIDEEGHNTAASVRNLEVLEAQHGLGRLLVVSHDHHTLRLQLSCHRRGLTCATVPAEQEYLLVKEPYYILREVAGVLYYALTFR